MSGAWSALGVSSTGSSWRSRSRELPHWAASAWLVAGIIFFMPSLVFSCFTLGGGGGVPFCSRLRCSHSEHLAETSDESCNLPLPFQVHTSLTKPKEQMMRPTQTQPSSMQKGDKTTPKKRKSTSSRAALVSVRCPTVDGYYWPYLNAKETVILEVATSLCLFF